MKVTMYSNFLNHHQLPFCEEMVRLLGDDFTFVASEPLPPERRALGYVDMNSGHEFVVRSYQSSANMTDAHRLAAESDVVVVGHAPQGVLEARMAQNKLTFRYAERLFKKSTFRRFVPTTHRKVVKGYTQYRKCEFYVLCASAFTAADLSLCGFPSDKCLRWGYFPEVGKLAGDLAGTAQQDGVLRLLWVGRLLDWKHPLHAVEVARRLNADGVRFTLELVGVGPEGGRIADRISSLGLSDCVRLLGGISPQGVRMRMQLADIFLFTSDRREGWGAVLNEAMASGCAVVASHAAGGVPYLVEHARNGLIYRSGDMEDLYTQIRRLAADPVLRETLGKEARATLACTWNASVAARRFLQTAEALRDGGSFPYEDGPCSRAPVLPDDWSWV